MAKDLLTYISGYHFRQHETIFGKVIANMEKTAIKPHTHTASTCHLNKIQKNGCILLTLSVDCEISWKLSNKWHMIKIKEANSN